MYKTMSTDSPEMNPVETLWSLCIHLSQVFSENPLQLIWEHHLQYVTANYLLQHGWTLRFGESGDKNTNVASVSYNHPKHIITRSVGDNFDSVDLKANRGKARINLELKAYSSLGRKKGRAGMGLGLRKDLKLVASGSAWFLFIADSESYQSMRGERRGVRGPKIRWSIDLPALEQVRVFDCNTSFAIDNTERFLWRIQANGLDRIICAMWLPIHGDIWQEVNH